MSDRIPRILFVCLGNICRSPMAEGIFRQKATELGVTVELDSCGTGGWHAGEAPDRRAQHCANAYGVDISDLRARQIRGEDFDHFDMIFVMDTSNYRDVLGMAGSDEQREKVHLLMNEVFPNEDRSVPDPYFGGAQGFDQVFDMLSRAADKVLNDLK